MWIGPLGPFFVCSVCLDIFARADWFVLIFLSVCFLPGARALSTFGSRFTDPEISRLASSLPLHCLGAKANSTTEHYSRAFVFYVFTVNNLLLFTASCHILISLESRRWGEHVDIFGAFSGLYL